METVEELRALSLFRTLLGTERSRLEWTIADG